MSRTPVSIIILAWNAWPATEACLDSIRPTLGVRDQVIVVDNGSTDGTATGLGRYPWAQVVSNEHNRGFAGGCNDGAAVATNEIAVFLNNDTVLAGRWIDPLVAALETPGIGAAGPRSNFVSGPQLVDEAVYTDIPAMRRFSREWCRAHRGERTETGRLVGFCLALRKDLFDAVGGFDEDYGTGGFEDDDLGRRILATGRRLVICHDSFVHHDGHKTFQANGLDWFAEQERNRDRFLTTQTDATQTDATPTVSACLITKDEEQNLPSCLESLRGLVDEVVVYDTGSTDSTVAIARASGATVLEGYWDDDFSRARNASLQRCSGEWIAWLDADETFEGLTDETLRAALVAVAPDVDALSVAIHNEMGSGVGSSFVHRAARLFRRSRCEWAGVLHEQIVTRKAHRPIRQGDFDAGYIRHTGYLDAALENKDKRRRNLHLARVEVSRSSGWERAHSLTSLARSCVLAGEWDEAHQTALEALDNHPNAVVRRMAMRAAIEALTGSGKFEEAIEWCGTLRRESRNPLLADMLEVRIHLATKDWPSALEILERVRPGSEDEDGYQYGVGSLAVQKAEALAGLERYSEAADALIHALFDEGVLDTHVGTLVEFLDKSKRPLEDLARAIPEERIAMFLAQVLQLDPAVGDRLLEVCFRRPAIATPVLAAAATLAKRLPITRALVWAARIRRAGFATACPLLAMAKSSASPVIRVRAAATAVAAFGDDAGKVLVLDAFRQSSPSERAELREEIGRLSLELAQILPSESALAAEEAAPIEASIVIPCFNKAELTLQCLQSLAAHTGGNRYEVILVDNGSTDATACLTTSESERFTVIRNTTNLGFAPACNQGAAAARGDVIVFLNNDIIAHPRWLQPLLDCLRQEPDVGIVGSRLLFPDGSIQHAGVDLGHDEAGLLHGFHVYYREPGDCEAALTARNMPAVTGAALAIRRSLFEQVGGFHEGYWNGNEDVDLCLSVTEAGYRIRYEPSSVLTHFESQSGTARFTGYGANVALFNERWGNKYSELTRHASMPVLAR